jgi:hypothetical protein
VATKAHRVAGSPGPYDSGVTDSGEAIQSAVPRSGLTPLELAHDLLSRIDRGNDYARTRKRRFRRGSTVVRLASLMFSGAATIILGLQSLDGWTALGFSLVAIATVVSALEPFFAWRSRWVLMEESQYKFYRLRDDLTYYMAATPAEGLDADRLNEFFDQYQQVWDQLGERWLEYRRHAGNTP